MFFLLTVAVAAAAPGQPSVRFDLPQLAGDYDGKLVSAALRRSSGALVACYAKAHAANPKLSGMLIVTFTIDTDGEVSAATASGFGVAGSECVIAALLRLELTPAPDAAVQVSDTIRFGPPSSNAGAQDWLEAQFRNCTCLTVTSLYDFVTPSVSFGVPIVSGPGQLDAARIRRVFAREREKLAYCYDRQLLAKPKLSGSLTAELAIDDSGKVEASRVISSSLHDPDVEACVVATINAMRFPRPVAGKVSVRYPMTFTPATH